MSLFLLLGDKGAVCIILEYHNLLLSVAIPICDRLSQGIHSHQYFVAHLVYCLLNIYQFCVFLLNSSMSQNKLCQLSKILPFILFTNLIVYSHKGHKTLISYTVLYKEISLVVMQF